MARANSHDVLVGLIDGTRASDMFDRPDDPSGKPDGCRDIENA
jgi:hypothetical protein